MHTISLHLIAFLLILSLNIILADVGCQLDGSGKCATRATGKKNDKIRNKIQKALDKYVPCDTPDMNCTCYHGIIERDLALYETDGITRQMIENSAKYGTRYKIYNKRLYRDKDCMFPTRCAGIEHFLLKLLSVLPNMDLIINTRDWPQLSSAWNSRGPVFSFSKTTADNDIMYPAWTFWAGGPAISLHPTGLGRWDLMRDRLFATAKKVPWYKKEPIGFFRGSRTSDERDTVVLLSREDPNLVDAQYTKNQAWKTAKDTLYAQPAQEVSFEEHCKYKYLFNFRGVAASFRFKHLFLCNSLVLHVGNEWQEFFYKKLKPWVHYVPIKSYPNEDDLESILNYFRKNDQLAREIAARGFDFIWQHLRMEDVECYWRVLLQKYAKFLKYDIQPDNSLIEISNAKEEL